MACIWSVFLFSQQVPDTNFKPNISHPAYASGEGPIVYIDAGHLNFHSRQGRYRVFADLLESDGYQIIDYPGKFEKEELEKGKILVISNALSENVEDWVIPNPSAFSKTEIAVLKQWVKEGGSLFLIADHMPFADASKDLAVEFGFEFTNGFVFDSRTDWRKSRSPSIFRLQNHSLIESLLTSGRDSSERVEQVASFTGQAFQIPEDAQSILNFDEHYINLIPDTSWVFDETTQEINASGWSQGAYKTYGEGRVVVFGEAGMFTAQLAGPNKIKMGMNHELASHNYQLLLNIIHWLDGKLNRE